MRYRTFYASPLGQILLESDGTNITLLAIEGQSHFCQNYEEEYIYNADLPVFVQTKAWLTKYFSGEVMPVMDIPLSYHGTPFQELVWHEVQQISYGQVRSYQEIAAEVAFKMHRIKMSSQAVGHAIGLNPIVILIPCHRVVGSNHTLGGYNGGITLKQTLLAIETQS